MSLLLILAVPVVAATTFTMAACILAGRSECSLPEPALNGDADPREIHSRPLPSEPAPVPVRFGGQPDRVEF